MSRNVDEAAKDREFEEKSKKFVEYVKKLREKNHNKATGKKKVNPYVTIRFVHILKESEKAYLFAFEDGGEHWFPKSMIRVDKRGKRVEMPYRFADEKAILEFKVEGA